MDGIPSILHPVIPTPITAHNIQARYYKQQNCTYITFNYLECLHEYFASHLSSSIKYFLSLILSALFSLFMHLIPSSSSNFAFAFLLSLPSFNDLATTAYLASRHVFSILATKESNSFTVFSVGSRPSSSLLLDE